MSRVKAEYLFEAPLQGVEVERTAELGVAPVSELAIAVQGIGLSAYMESDWVCALAAANETEPITLASEVFDPSDESMVATQTNRIAASKKRRSTAEYWFATAYFPGDLATVMPHGFVKVEQQGWRKNPTRAIQYLTHTGIYACLHDINVRPEVRGRGIATALAHAGLSNQPKCMPSSLYTAASNEPMRAWAEKFGYRVTDEYEEVGLIDGISIPFLRMQAESVGEVLSKMEEARPELTNPIYSHDRFRIKF